MKRDVSGQKCPSCETGRQMLFLDPRELFCPYISNHRGHSCAMYVPIQANSISEIYKEEFVK